jgi:hypothetical protein
MNKHPENKRIVGVDVCHKVMDKIKRDDIRMKSPFFFLAKKLGLESVLILAVFSGALLVNILLYFLKKTKLIKFLAFGWPGLKVFLTTLPYDYIALFIFTLILANYIVKKIDFSVKKIISVNTMVIFLFLISVFLGTFFAMIGVDQIIKGWSKNCIPKETSISGVIIDYTEKYVMVAEDNGVETMILFEYPSDLPYARGKSIRALGRRDNDNHNIFQAERINCCDD